MGVTECFGMELPPRARGEGVFATQTELEPYWPTGGWREADPAEVGFDADRLDAALSFSTPYSNTQAVVVIRHGYIAAERYFGDATEEQRHESYSMAKSFSSVLVGIAIEQGLLSSTDELVCRYYDEWDCDDDADPRSRITVDHIMNISSGLDWNEEWRSDSTGINDVFLGFADLVTYTLAKPAVDEPGEVMRYSTGDPSLLTGVFEGATGQTAEAYAHEVLLDPIGLSEIDWASDPAGRTTTYAGISATAREYAKLGYLALREGQWDGEQIVPAEWIERTTQPVDPCTDQYRYLWHVNMPMRLGEADPSCDEILGCAPLSIANLPSDGYFAEGISGQFIFVMPSADLVVVRLAADDPGSERWDEFARGFVNAILASIVD